MRIHGFPRTVEAVAALAGLVVLAPLFALIALAVAVSSPGGVFFRQTRMGRGGEPFTLVKFRTMRPAADGPLVTAKDDPRVTPLGRILRRTKFDELPGLWNVLVGEMSLVGPRPEVPKYVDLDDPRWRRVLASRPGLTDPVTIRLRDEEELLASAGANRPRFYEETLVPYKLRGYIEYLDRRTAWSDLAVLVATLRVVVRPGRTDAPSRDEIERVLHSGMDNMEG